MIWATILNVLARLLGRVLPFVAVWAAAKRDARQRAKIDDMEAYRDTRERMDKAPRHTDADLARKRMRERGRKS